MSKVYLTEDRRCGQCVAPVESVEGEPADEAMGALGQRVILSVWYTLQPCGHSYKKATGASLD